MITSLRFAQSNAAKPFSAVRQRPLNATPIFGSNEPKVKVELEPVQGKDGTGNTRIVGWRPKAIQNRPTDTTDIRQDFNEQNSIVLALLDLVGNYLGSAWFPEGSDSKTSRAQPLSRYEGPEKYDQGLSIQRWPAYAIAKLNVPIETFRMCRCAVFIAITDTFHYVLHNKIGTDVNAITHNLRQFFKETEFLAAKRFILPGGNADTKNTVQNLLEASDQLVPNSSQNIQFIHYPPEVAAHAFSPEVKSLYKKPGCPACKVNDTVSVISYNGGVYYRLRKPQNPDFQKHCYSIINKNPGIRPITLEDLPIAQRLEDLENTSET